MTKSPWILVSERLPDKTDDYLVTTKIGTSEVAYFKVDSEHIYPFLWRSSYTKWMEIPD